jgi:hypothetical protein
MEVIGLSPLRLRGRVYTFGLVVDMYDPYP